MIASVIVALFPAGAYILLKVLARVNLCVVGSEVGLDRFGKVQTSLGCANTRIRILRPFVHDDSVEFLSWLESRNVNVGLNFR